jgi:hypothetical protein
MPPMPSKDFERCADDGSDVCRSVTPIKFRMVEHDADVDFLMLILILMLMQIQKYFYGSIDITVVDQLSND